MGAHNLIDFGSRCTEAHARFLALRYGGILATLPVLFLSATQTNSCQAAASLSQVGVVVVVTSSALIFTCRTRLLWSNNRVLGVALGGMLIIMTGAWVCTFGLPALLSTKLSG
jgi:hypothetical protein